MPDYAKTVIYQIECKDPKITKTYGGHSTNLIKRRQKHKSACNNPNSEQGQCYVYRFIRENGGWHNWQVVWQYDYPCASKKEATLEETKFIKEHNCELNSIAPYQSEEEKKGYYKEYNAKYMIKYMPKYRAKKKAEETEEEKNERLRQQREYDAKRNAKKKANNTPEQEAERLEKEKIRSRNRRENETEEEKKERLRKQREYVNKKNADIRANETEEEKKKRLEKEKIRKRNRRENETEEKKKERLRKRREKYAAKKKAEKEAQTNLMVNAELKTI